MDGYAATLAGTTAAPRVPPNTRRMLEGRPLATLLRLAAPNLAEAAARVGFIAADAVFVGWLGADALAGVSLVFPILLLSQMVSASGIGTGVAAAVARALGAGRRAEADGLAANALWVALAAGLGTTALMLPAGAPLYAALGARGAALEAAVAYSDLVFAGVAAVWTMNLLANVARGTGAMPVAAGAIVVGEAVHLALSPALILGWGPFPAMGVRGAACAVIASYATGAVVLLAYLLSGRAAARIRGGALAPRRTALRAILGLGARVSLAVLLTQATTMAATALVARFGAGALAGYGAAQRLELLQMPLTFALGSAMVAMVAANLGAGRAERARQVARAGTALAGGVGLAFGAVALTLPQAWMALFVAAASEPLAAGVLYLRTIGAILPLFGMALGAAFALMGMGEAGGLAAASALRFGVTALGGVLAAELGWGLPGVFGAVALAMPGFAALVLLGRSRAALRGR